MISSDGDILNYRFCQFHKRSLEYACLEKNCYSKIKQICTKCVRIAHFNHRIVDIKLLVSCVEQLKSQLIKYAAKFDLLFIKIPIQKFKDQLGQDVYKCYLSYKKKYENLIFKIIDLTMKLQKCEEFDYSDSIINKAISIVGKMELIRFYFIRIPQKWIKNILSKMKLQTIDSLKESDILINCFDHNRFKKILKKKVEIKLTSYKEVKLSNLGGEQLVIIQSNTLYILEQEEQKQRLLQHTVETKINNVYQYKQQQNLLITCGSTQPILVNHRIFNISSNYLLRVDFLNGEIKILQKVYIKGLKNIFKYDKNQVICQANSNSIYLLNTLNLKIMNTYKIQFLIDEIMCFHLKNEVLLFCQEKLICINLLTKKQSCVVGSYDQQKKKKLDETHYVLWNHSCVEIFDVLKSHIKPVVTFHIQIIDIELVQGKIFFIGKDKLLHIYR